MSEEKEIPVEDLLAIPPGGGQFTIPTIQQFQGIYNPITKVFKNPDEAVRQSKINSLAMRRSLVIMEPLVARQMATAELSWHIEPEDNKDKEQQQIAKGITRIVEEIPDRLQLFMSLLEAVFFGRWGTMLRYRWDFGTGRKRMVVGSWLPVNGDSLQFKYDTDQIGVLCQPTPIGGGTKDLEARAQPTEIARAVFLTQWEREAFLVHKHFIQAGDFTEPEASGSIHGIGLRTYLYWAWNCMMEALAWATEYLERTGMGLWIYRFPLGNSEAEKAVRQAAATQAYNNVIIWPATNDQKFKDIERIEPSAVGIDSLMRVVQDYYGGLLKRYILGTVNNAESGMNRAQTNTEIEQGQFERIVRFDSANLAETLTRDLISVLVKYNYPGCPYKFRFKFNVDSPDPDKVMRAAQTYYNLGGDLDGDSLRSVLGLEKPTEDSTILRRPMTMMEAGAVDQPGSTGDKVETGEENPGGESKDSDAPATKIDKIKQTINSLGVNARAEDIMASLQSGGTPVSRSLVYGVLQKLRGPQYNSRKGRA